MKTPDLSEFISLEKRRAENRSKHGFRELTKVVTVAVYNTRNGYQTLTVRISNDLAKEHGLIEGAKMSCHIHPDQGHLALAPGHGAGAALFRPKGSKSLIYQTTLKGGTLTPQKALRAVMEKRDDVLVISMINTHN